MLDLDEKIIVKDDFLNDFVIINIVDVHKELDEILLKELIFLLVLFNLDLSRSYKIKIFENAFNSFKKVIDDDELIVED